MDVTCDRCGTEYEFDETLLSAKGTTVKCTNCGHVFKVYPSPGTEADRTTSSWRVRRRDGTVESVGSLRELQRRISAGKLTRNDEIARGREPWKALGSIPELETFFQAAQVAPPTVVEPAPTSPDPSQAQASAKKPARQKTLVGVMPVPRGPARTSSTPPARTAPGSTPTAAAASPAPSRGATPSGGYPLPPEPDQPELPPEPEVAFGTEPESPTPSDASIEDAQYEDAPRRSSAPPVYYDDDDDIPMLAAKRGSSLGNFLGIAVLLAGAVAVAVNWSSVAPLVGLAPTVDVGAALQSADTALALDHYDAYLEAISQYEAILPEAGDRAAEVNERLALAHTLAAQAAEYAALDAGGAEREQRTRQVKDHATKSAVIASELLATNPEDTARPRLLLADAKRLQGDLKSAATQLEKVRAIPFTRNADYFRVQALLEAASADGDFAAAREEAQQAVTAAAIPRHRLLLARALVADGSVALAEAELAAVGHTQASHPDISRVRRLIDAAAKPEAAVQRDAGGAATADESTPAETAPDAGTQSADQEPATETPAPTADAADAADAADPADPADAAGKGVPETTAEEKVTEPKEAPPSTKRSKRKKAAARTAPRRPRRDAYDEYDRDGDADGALVDGRPLAADYAQSLRQAQAALAGGQYSRARMHFENALEARPGSGEATRGLGMVARKEGNSALALRYFKSATRRGDVESYFRMGQAYQTLGKKEQAVSSYFTYLNRRPRGRFAAEARATIKKLEPYAKLPEDPNAPPPPEQDPKPAPGKSESKPPQSSSPKPAPESTVSAKSGDAKKPAAQ